MQYKLITDELSLKTPCEPVSLDEGMEIAYLLFDILSQTKGAVGVAANQIGINKRVCVVNVVEPLCFINPIICSVGGSVIFNEGCLSFPNRNVMTQRHRIIGVRADNFEGDFKMYTCAKNELECVCIQHEIDHLNGITMFDREVKR